MAQERERVGKRATITVVSANLGRWLGGLSSIPQEVIKAGHTVLRQAKQIGPERLYQRLTQMAR